MFELKCPKCDFSKDIPNAWEGKKAKCDKCRHVFVAPRKVKLEDILVLVAGIWLIEGTVVLIMIGYRVTEQLEFISSNDLIFMLTFFFLGLLLITIFLLIIAKNTELLQRHTDLHELEAGSLDEENSSEATLDK